MNVNARRSKYPKQKDQNEIRISKVLHEKGISIRNLENLSELPEMQKVEIAEFLVSEIPILKNESLKCRAILACSQPQFHDIVLPALISIAKQEALTSHLISSTVANGLIRVIRKEDADIIGDLLLDKNFGKERGMLVPFYAKFTRKTGIPILLKCVEDNDTKVEALKALSQLGEIWIKPQLDILTADPNSYHRKVARDGLKRLEKHQMK